VKLSELFAPGKDTLAVYSFMYGPRGNGHALDARTFSMGSTRGRAHRSTYQPYGRCQIAPAGTTRGVGSSVLLTRTTRHRVTQENARGATGQRSSLRDGGNQTNG
jgi:hypothetical protein